MAKIPESLIDDILESAKKYNGEDAVEEYSFARIDALLADIMGADSKEEEKPVSVVLPKATPVKAEPVEEQKAEEKTIVIKPVAPAPKKAEKKFEIKISELTVKEPEEKEVAVSVADDGQIGLIDDGTLISTPAEEVPEELPEVQKKPEIQSADSQISIEKTRMFNEVDIRGAYNPNISHNLGNKVVRTTTGDGEALSSAAMGEEKYRKHFMNKPVQNLEKTQEHRALIDSLPQKTIETPGVVVKRAASSNTDGFEPLPTIVPAEDMLEKEEVSSSREEDNQIMFEGFIDDEPVMQQSEEEAEAQLRETRKGVVDEFVKSGLIFKQEVDESEEEPDIEAEPVRRKRRFERRKVSVAREYFGPKDKKAVRKVFETEKKGIVARLVILSFIAFVMCVLAAVAGAENGNFEIYGNNEFVYVAVQLALLLCACVVSFSSFKNAVAGLKNKTADIDTVIAVSAVAGIVQCIAGFAFTDNVESTAHLIAGAAVVPMILKAVSELVRCKTDAENFEVIASNDAPHSVENIGHEDTANEIARGLMLGDPDIKYSARIGFPARFVELSRSAEVTGPLLKIAVPAVAAVAFLAGVIYGFVSKNAFAGFSTFAGVVLMGLPMAAGLSAAVNLRAVNKKLNPEGAIINGYSAVEDAVNSNGVVIDACDAFQRGGCNIEGMKIYHKMRVDEAILYTASVVIASGGVMAEIFEGVIDGKRQLLFPVESLSYEEKLGCSCWIHNHRVLVGNRELLVHHNVEVPDKALEEKFKQNGRNVIYLAIEGKISAMFVVVYKANEETAKYMRELEKDGLTIFFRTSDANITEQFLEREFGLPSNVVKIINPVAGEMFTKIKNNEAERADAKIIHRGGIKTMLMALHASFEINNFVNVSRVIQFVAAFLGAAGVVLLAFLSGLAQIGVWQIIIYQTVWAIVLSLLPMFRKI